jgi:hypothetical protein
MQILLFLSGVVIYFNVVYFVYNRSNSRLATEIFCSPKFAHHCRYALEVPIHPYIFRLYYQFKFHFHKIVDANPPLL